MTARSVQPGWLVKLAVTILLPLATGAAGAPGSGHSHTDAALHSTEPSALRSENAEASTIRFLTERVSKDPLDFSSKNRLAAIYLRRLGRLGNHADLHRARELARSSLSDFPARINSDALSVLAQAELAAHQFDAAAQLARELIRIRPRDASAQLILGDALFETGDYDGAAAIYRLPERNASARSADMTVSIETRLGKLAWLHGDIVAAGQHLDRALEAALMLPAGNEDRVAWCQWQIGEMAFARGDLATAEAMQLEALQSSQRYARAIAALARIRAAQGNSDEAISLYNRAIELNPHIRFVAALGDLHRLSGNHEHADVLYRRAERIGFDLDNTRRQSGGGISVAIPESIESESQWPDHYGRDLALFYADRDLKPGLALQIALREYDSRRDVYTADALAWAALKAGDFDLAASTIHLALRPGTEDAQLYYHAGMIAHAGGNDSQARYWLQRALTLNRHFDARQAHIARQLMARLDASCRTCPADRSASPRGHETVAALRDKPPSLAGDRHE